MARESTGVAVRTVPAVELTDLPEGTQVELASTGDEPWELTREQHAKLAARLASADRGPLVPAAEVFARLRGG